MKDHPLYPLATRLRPELRNMDGPASLQTFSEVLTVLYLLPISIFGVVWLALTKADIHSLQDIILLTLITVGILITNLQTAVIYVGVGSRERLALSSSLGSLLYWAGLLLWGPITIWASLIADVLTNIAASLHMKRVQQNAFWGPFAGMLQSLSPIPGVLLALWLYKTLGGTFPFASVNVKDWFPALTAIVVSSIFPSLVMLPVFGLITSLTGVKSTTSAVMQFIFSAVAFNIIPAPFGIPVALLFIKAGSWPFAAIVIGVVLVNYMAHHLSRTNQRNIQQAQEMEHLEKLGEEILKSHPDGSMLAEIVHKRIKSMFSSQTDIVAVQLFDDVPDSRFADRFHALNLIHPKPSLAPDSSVWEMLHQCDEDHFVLKDQIPQGFDSVYGDAVLVKVLNAEPATDGKEPVCIGGIYLLMNKSTSRTIDSLSAVQALASQIASAIYRAQVYEETLAAQKMSQELEFAGQIQASFLPEHAPVLDGWSIAATLIPARQTSGDFYDFIELPERKLGVLVADVADKGTGAALYMALSRTLLRTFAQQYPNAPTEVFRKVNDRLFEDSRADQFVTVFYGVLDPATGRFEYCNAGHNPAFLIRTEGVVETLTRTGTALGAMEELTWKSASVNLQKGDKLILYTDGIVEAQNKDGEFFGEELLKQAIKGNDASADAIQYQVMDQLTDFVSGADQFDDITMLTLKRN